jgi:hypothetical protein
MSPVELLQLWLLVGGELAVLLDVAPQAHHQDLLCRLVFVVEVGVSRPG